MIIDLLTGWIKDKYFKFIDSDGKFKSEYFPIHTIADKSVSLKGKKKEFIIVEDVDGLAYFKVDVTTLTPFTTLKDEKKVGIINDGKGL